MGDTQYAYCTNPDAPRTEQVWKWVTNPADLAMRITLPEGCHTVSVFAQPYIDLLTFAGETAERAFSEVAR